MINFVITSDDKYLLGNSEISAEQLEQVISEQAKTMLAWVLIQTDEYSTHGAIVKLMDSARNAGVTNISVVGL